MKFPVLVTTDAVGDPLKLNKPPAVIFTVPLLFSFPVEESVQLLQLIVPALVSVPLAFVKSIVLPDGNVTTAFAAMAKPA